MMRSDESFNGSSCERCCLKKSADFLDFCGFHKWDAYFFVMSREKERCVREMTATIFTTRIHHGSLLDGGCRIMR